jgi:hypothetical protein
MKLPQGELRRRRVVTDISTVFANALDTELTGYARLEPQDTLLLDAEGIGVVTFENGVPGLAYHTGTDSGGPDALADVAVDGPYRLELYELDRDSLPSPREAAALAVPPGMPADRLAGDSELAARTREKAPSNRVEHAEESAGDFDAVESFLDDETTIQSIRERAQEEATRRADEWGFQDQTVESH